MKLEFVFAILALVFLAMCTTAQEFSSPVSRTITQELRTPLPPEDLHCSEDNSEIFIEGPTFRYVVDKDSGSIKKLEAERNGQMVVKLLQPVVVRVDNLYLGTSRGGTTSILSQGKEQVILTTEGSFGADLDYSLQSKFYNDGVVVKKITLKPVKDVPIYQGIRFEVSASGRFKQYLHKRRDTNGIDCLQGALPKSGEQVELPYLTSCLEMFGPEAALAIFTDRGGTYRYPGEAATASIRINEVSNGDVSGVLSQHIIRVDSGGPPYVLRSGEEFTFRVGLAVAPNRLPHPRWRDLRMFTWIGDECNPYPTDEEIHTIARLGFTLFQMHRLGTPGEPRPPEGELERVLDTVHQAGMLFIWTANADLIYVNSQGAKDRVAAHDWAAWQGFNYGGNYQASMDGYCDLAATCLASPNGLADYRIACKERMLEKYAIDGMYIDDNLAYANCTLWKEHGHPEKVYDCLIELHDMNWRRRQTIRAHAPHAVLIDHCSQAFVLPVISAFDAHLFGEGNSLPSVETYWSSFGSLRNMPAQGMIWPGDSESTRCVTESAYAFDLLTGGGQYSYLDWRLWPDKFPYAAGVHPQETMYVKTYNLAQYYFGMYESDPYYYAQSEPWATTSDSKTYATAYHNKIWDDALIVVVNMNETATKTSLSFTEPRVPFLAINRQLVVYDVNKRNVDMTRGTDVSSLFSDLDLDAGQMQLVYVREAPSNAVYHVWGGKRITEAWDATTRKLVVQLFGPVGLEDLVVFGIGDHPIDHVSVNGRPIEFFIDPDQNILHGMVTFSKDPVSLAVVCARDGISHLPSRSLGPDQLAKFSDAQPAN